MKRGEDMDNENGGAKLGKREAKEAEHRKFGRRHELVKVIENN